MMMRRPTAGGRVGSRLKARSAKLLKRSLGLSTSWARPLPDFLILGAQRAGTSALYTYLAEHPNVKPASKKEIRYFDVHFEKGLLWYRSHFPSRSQLSRNQKWFLTGEATPAYLYHPHVPERVAHTLPGGRFVVLLRDPVERAHSAWRLMVQLGHERLPFGDALEAEEARVGANEQQLFNDRRYHSPELMHFAYLRRGIYAEQLERWFKWFPQGSFLIVRSEDLFERPAAGYQEVLRFLQLPVFQFNGYRPVHGVEGPPLEGRTREALKAFFKPHNERLYDLIGRDFQWDG